MPSVARKNQSGRKSALWFAVAALCASLVASVPAVSAAQLEPSEINTEGLFLPDGISLTMITDYSKVPSPAKEGANPYNCLGLYLVSSLSSPTVVHVTGLSLSEVQDGESILYGGALSGYLTIPPNTLNSAYLSSNQALGRLSPSGYFSNPLKPLATSNANIPDVLNCQSPEIGRMFGLTIPSRVNYVYNQDLFISGTVELASPSTYDVSSVVVPDGYTATTKYRDADGYAISCITRNGRATTIGVALKKNSSARTYLSSSANYIARDVTVDGTEYPTPGIPHVRTPCVPVAIIPNDDGGDVTGDRQMVIAATISKWSGSIINQTKLSGISRMAKYQWGMADSDGVQVTYNPTIDTSFVWLTAKSRGALAKCVGSSFTYAKIAGTYSADGVTTKGTLLVTKSSASKKPIAIGSSSGADTYALLSLAGNVFASDGKLMLTGSVVAADTCRK